MQLAILEKLTKELIDPVQGEPQVLYILAEIRKYIEEYEISNRDIYQNLYFFSNWVLHITLDRVGAEQLLKKFEGNLGDIKPKTLTEIGNEFKINEESFYKFDDLKGEIASFLDLHSLPKKLVEDRNYWDKFKLYLIGILTDCPIRSQEGILEKFVFIETSDKKIRFIVRIKRKGSVKFTVDR